MLGIMVEIYFRLTPLPSSPCNELAACKSSSSLEYVLSKDFRFLDLSFDCCLTNSDFVGELVTSEGNGEMRSLLAFLSFVGGSEVTGKALAV